MPLDPDDEIEPRALGLRAPQMLGRHLHLAERVFLDTPVLMFCRCARHDIPYSGTSICEEATAKSKAPHLLRAPSFSISPRFAPDPTPLEAGRDRLNIRTSSWQRSSNSRP